MKRILDSPDFKVAHRYQLNEAGSTSAFFVDVIYSDV